MPDWNQIIDDHGSAVWRQALRILGSEADAADCFQLTLLEAFQKSQHTPILNWPAFLTRLATLRALDFLRRRRRHPTSTLPDHLSARATAPRDADLAENLRGHLATLPDDQAQAFALRHIEGLSGDQTAALMGLSANHVAVLIHRARHTLRQRLQGEPL